MLKMAIVFLSLFLIAICPALPQQEETTIRGKVVDIGWLKRNLSIRTADSRSGRPDHILVQVPKDAELTRGTKSISFLDIKISDSVMVTYYDDGLTGLKVRSLRNLNLGQ
jgi:hypothetical protein